MNPDNTISEYRHQTGAASYCSIFCANLIGNHARLPFSAYADGGGVAAIMVEWLSPPHAAPQG